MRSTTVTTTATALHSLDAGPTAPLAEERPAYRYVGNGTFEPANIAAVTECENWNRFADTWNARTAARSNAQ